MALTLLLSSTGCEGNKHNQYKSQCWHGPSHWINDPDCYLKYRGGHHKYCLISTFLLLLFILNINIVSLCKHNDLYCVCCFLFSSFGFWREKNRIIIAHYCVTQTNQHASHCASHITLSGGLLERLIKHCTITVQPWYYESKGWTTFAQGVFPNVSFSKPAARG